MLLNTSVLLVALAFGLTADAPDHTELTYAIQENGEDGADAAAIAKLLSERFSQCDLSEVRIVVGDDEASLKVVIPGDDLADVQAAKVLISGKGALAFRIVAADATDPELPAMRDALMAAQTEHGTLTARQLADLSITRDDGTRIEWRSARETDESSPTPLYMALLIPADGGFTGRDLAGSYVTTDSGDFPALGFELKAERAEAFGDLTGQNQNRKLAILTGDVVLCAPVLHGKITNRGQITGGSHGFTSEELQSLRTALDSSDLPAKLTLTAQRQVRSG